MKLARSKEACAEKKYILVLLDSTLKPWYKEPQYSEFRDIMNKTQLPFLGFTKHITFDIL